MSDTVDDYKYNTDLATRQVEINEWTYNNKMDTLFVFQIIFLAILMISLLIALKGYGLLGSAVTWYSAGIITLLCVIVVFNRAYYTAVLRDKRYWNERRFSDDGVKSGALAPGSTAIQDNVDAIRGHFGESGRDTAPPCTCP